MTFIGLPAFQISIDSFKTIGVGLLKMQSLRQEDYNQFYLKISLRIASNISFLIAI